MNKSSFFTVMLLLYSAAVFAQGVGISSDNSAPDNSAMLDVKSTSKGMLVPRMTATQRDAISNPAKGLLIFCTTDNQYYFNRSGIPSLPNWQKLNSQWETEGSHIYYDAGNVGIGEPSPAFPLNFASTLGDKISLYGTTASHYGFGIQGGLLQIYSDNSSHDVAIGSGSSGAFSETVRFKGNGQVGIGTLTPNSSAKLDVQSSSQGLLIPRMTNAQISSFGNTLGADDIGMIVFNSDDIKLEYWDGTAWKTMVTKATTAGGSSDGTSFCSEGVTDYDGHQYKTVKIGDQCWMAENLKSTHYADGSAISEYWAYDNDEALAHTYGRLYTWAAVMNGAASSNSNPSGVQGICPNGWHVPSDAEWKELEMTLGMTTAEANAEGYRGSHFEGRKLKETDEAFLWSTGSVGGTNISGFSGLPGGALSYYGYFYGVGNIGYWWTSTENDSSNAWERDLNASNSGVVRNYFNKENGFSVRCVRD